MAIAAALQAGRRCPFAIANDRDLSAAYPKVIAAGRKLRAGTVACSTVKSSPSIATAFPRSRRCSTVAPHPDYTIVYYAFDLLHLDGESLTTEPLHERRRRLPGVIAQSGLLISETLSGTAAEVIEAVKAWD